MGSLRRLALLLGVAALVLVAGGTSGRAALPDAAPALTPQQLAGLQAITSWDYTYSYEQHDDYTNSGGSYISFSGVEVSTWTFERHATQTITATGTFTGPAGCAFDASAPPAEKNPCHIDPSLPNNATARGNRATSAHWTAAQGCPTGPLTDAVADSTFSYDTHVHVDAGSLASVFGGFGIAYNASPPHGQAGVSFNSLPGTLTETAGGCGQSQTSTNDASASGGIAFTFGDSARCCNLGDTQVKVDRRGLVITGRSDATQSVDTCFVPVSPASGIFPCLTTGSVAADRTTVRASWTIRPHVEGLDVAAIEVNQAVQDWRNTVPLTQGKSTIARVFMSWHGEHPHTTSALLYGSRDGSPLPGSPLAPMNDHFSATADVLENRGELFGSLNFMLPASWTRGTVTLEVKLPEEDSTPLNCTEAASPADDCQAVVSFSSVSPLQVKLVAVTWTHRDGQLTETTPYSSLAKEADILRALLPGASVDWTAGNLDVGVAPSDDLSTLERPVNSRLEAMRALDGCGAGCNRIYVGVLTEAFSDMGMADAIPGVASAVFFSGLAADAGRNTIAHEVGHNLGRQHDTLAALGPYINSQGTNTGSPQGPCEEVAHAGTPDYPWFGSFADLSTQVRSAGAAPTQPGLRPLLGRPGAGIEDEVWGLDTTEVFANPSVAVLPPSQVFDLMGYCTSLGGHEDEWPSARTYTALRDAMNSRFPPAPNLRRSLAARRVLPREGLLVRGTVNLRTGAVEYDAAFPSFDDPATPAGAYVLEARDASGGLLQSVPLALEPSHVEGEPPAGFTQSDPSETGVATFIARVPLGTASLRLLDHGTAVGDALSASAHAPSVSIGSARYDASRGTIDVAWNARDLDGDPLHAAVEYSADGATWQTLGIDVPGNSYSVSASASAGSAAARVRVVVSDGLRIASADSAPFALGNRAPQIAILDPAPLATLAASGPVLLRAVALDAEDGPVSSVRWSLDGRDLGTGATLPVAAADLAGGRCLRAAATDAAGLSAAAQIPFGAAGSCPAGSTSAPVSSPAAPATSAPAPLPAVSTPPAASAPPTSAARPTLRGAVAVAVRRNGAVIHISARVTVAAAATIEIHGTVDGRAVVFEPRSRVNATVTGRPHTVIYATVGRAGSFPLELLVRRRHRAAMAKLSVVAVGRDGQTATLPLHANVG